MILTLPTLAEPQHFHVAEKLLFIVLAAASGYGFWRRFGPILNRILSSKKDADFRLFPIGRRLWDFFWQVMCQAKVIRQRPLPGLAHAFVFWAFCAFALVTLNHCASLRWPAQPASWVFLSAVFWCGPNGWASSFPGNRG